MHDSTVALYCDCREVLGNGVDSTKTYLRIVVVMVTVCSNQVVAGRNPVVHCLIPVVQIQGMLAGVLKITSEMTTTEAKPKTEKERENKKYN